MTKNKEHILKYINIALTVGLFYFAYVYGKSLTKTASDSNLQVNYFILSIAAFVFFIFYYVLSIHWLRVCRQFDRSASKIQMLAFFASQPYKYLPTSLFTFSFRAKYSAQAGLGLKKSSLAQLVENMNILVAGAVVAVFFYAASRSLILLPIFVAVVLMAYILLPKKIALKFKQKNISVDKKEATINIGIASLAWVIAGLAFYTVGRAINVEVTLLTAIAANTLAYIAGILVIFAPGGLGVRELVFSIFSISVPIIVVWRMLTFVCDMVFGFAAVALLRSRVKLRS